MPFYDFHCDECGTTEAVFRKVDQRNIPEYHCSKAMTRVISKATIRPDIAPFISPASGKWINSRAQRDEDLKREGCIINEPGLKSDVQRRASELQEAHAESCVAHIDQTVSALHAAGHI